MTRLVASATEAFSNAMAANQRDATRLLLRLFGCLVVVNVLQPSGVVALVEGLVNMAVSTASAGGSSGACWMHVCLQMYGSGVGCICGCNS